MNDDRQAETHWVHLFKDMVFSGDVAKLGPFATTIYLVIKAYTDQNGEAFPSVEKIAEMSGISEVEIKRKLKVLEAEGYITKHKVWKRNVYQLREKISIKGPGGVPTHIASWDYVPQGVKQAVTELKNFMTTGEFADAKVINITTLNIQVNVQPEIAVGTIESNNVQQHIRNLRGALGKE